MCDYVKEEIFLEEEPNVHMIKEEVKIEDQGVVVAEKVEFPCELCGKKYGRKSRLKEHLGRHGKEKNHKCEDCGRGFKLNGDLSKHIKMFHATEALFRCEVCSKSFVTLSLLKRHSVNHIEDRSHKCDQCSNAYKWKGNLDKHKAMVHRNEGRFPCEVCGKKFMFRAQFNEHTQRHGEEKSHKCSECDCAFKIKSDLIKHTNTMHATETPFRCEVCSKSFAKLSLLKKHSVNHSEERLHKCDQCSISYKWKRSLDHHVGTVHASEGRYPCAVCGKTFKFSVRLKWHMERHIKEKNHKCSECGWAFKIKGELIKHVNRKHPKETPFKCKGCSKSYAALSLLKKHSIIHNEEKPYKCDRCSEAYKWKGNLNKHKAMVHDKEGRFTCEVCGKKFLFPVKLKEHMARHNYERNVKCGECGDSFNNKTSLIRHRIEEHSLQCKVCFKVFSVGSCLKRHMLKHQTIDGAQHSSEIKNNMKIETGYDLENVIKSESLVAEVGTFEKVHVKIEPLVSYMKEESEELTGVTDAQIKHEPHKIEDSWFST